MRKQTLLTAVLTATILTSCGGGASGPAEKVLSKKIYTQLAGKYQEIYDFQNGVARVMADGRQYGLINGKGQEIVPANVYYIDQPIDGMYVACTQDNKYGAYNEKGKLVIPFEYDDISDFCDGYARVRKGQYSSESKYGFVDKTGKVVVPVNYDHASEGFSEGLAVVGMDGEQSDLYGYVNAKGEEVIPLQFKNADIFSEGLAAVRMKTGWGYINKKGELATSAKYYDAYPFSDGLAVVEGENNYSVINKTGELVFNLAAGVEPGEQFHEGMLLVFKNQGKKFGYYNKEGQQAIPFQYDCADGFKDGKALVATLQNKSVTLNTIDKNGTVTGTISSFDELDDYDYVEDLCYDAMYLMKRAESVSSTLSGILDELEEFTDDEDDYDDDDDW